MSAVPELIKTIFGSMSIMIMGTKMANKELHKERNCFNCTNKFTEEDKLPCKKCPRRIDLVDGWEADFGKSIELLLSVIEDG
jgi:hypothetical protein